MSIAESRHAVALSAGLWRATEGDVLVQFKDILPSLQANVALLAALGPAFWMVGQAERGLDAFKDAIPSPTGGDGAATAENGIDGEIELGACNDLPAEPERCVGALADALLGAPAGAADAASAAAVVPAVLLRACAFDGAGTNAYALTKYDEAAALHAHALADAEAHLAGAGAGARADDAGAAATAEAATATADALVVRSRALDGLGRVARERGDYSLSLRLHHAAAAAAREAAAAERSAGAAAWLRPPPLVLLANAVSNAGVAARRRAEKEERGRELLETADGQLSRCYHREALRLRERTGDLRGLASSAGNLAVLQPATEEGAQAALGLYEKSLETRRVLGDTWGVAGSLRAIAMRRLARRQAGDVDLARGMLAEAVPKFQAVGDVLGLAECLESLGMLSAGTGPGAGAGA
eukprot:g3043.t1